MTTLYDIAYPSLCHLQRSCAQLSQLKFL